MSITTAITKTDIVEVVREVWSALLGLEVEPQDGPPATASPTAATAQTDAAVSVEGSWCGQVHVVCSTPVATELAAAMLGVPAGEVDDVDASDALGELANVIGGNLKSMLPAPSRLSVPVVTHWTSPSGLPRAARSGEVTTVGFGCVGGRFEVSLRHLRMAATAQPA